MKLKTTLQCMSVGVLAILTAAWVAGFFGELGYGIRRGANVYQFFLVEGSVGVAKGRLTMIHGGFWIPLQEASPFNASLLYKSFPTINGWNLSLPIALLITAVLPFAYASFYGFRFRLWHYFLFTAIVAVQLTIYLRPM